MGLGERVAGWFGRREAQGPRAEITTSKELEEVLIAAGAMARSGVHVTPEGSIGVSAVSAAVGIIAESVAQLPLILYRRTGDRSKERATEHPLFRLLHDKPNSFQTSFEFREMMTLWLALHGNAYAMKIRVRGLVQELIPLHPTRVEPIQQDDFRVIYRITLANGERIERLQRDMIHIRDRSLDGVLGMSRVRTNREAIGLSQRLEHYGANFFGNSARPSGVLSTDQTLKPEQVRQLKDSWTSAHGGDNSGGTAVVDGGLSWTGITMSSVDAQYLENRKFQISEIARIWRVPPHMLADLDRATFSNIEQQSVEFVRFTLLPWVRRWESAINTQLIGTERADPIYSEFLLEGLLRGTAKERFESYAVAIQNGWMTRNEVRERENLNPIKGGDQITPSENLFGDAGESDEDQAA